MPSGAASTMEQTTNPQNAEYVKNLEDSVNWLEKKLKNSRNDIKAHKKEIDNLKDSNANLIFINEQLNKALKKSENRSE